MVVARFIGLQHRMFVTLLSCTLIIVGGFVAPPAMPVAAVNTLHVTDCGDSGASTLRGRIGSAGVGDTIVFDQDCTIVLVSTLTLATNNLTIDGTGRSVIVDGGCLFNGGACRGGAGVPVFVVNSGVTASITALTVQHGNNGNSGGGITNNGTLTLLRSTVTTNSANGGGGIANAGTLTIMNSSVTANSRRPGDGATSGGGLDNTGTVTAKNSTFSGNIAGGNGGAIANNGTAMTVTGSTLSGNTAGDNGSGDGGAISNSAGALAVANSTISGNTAAGGNGGGIESTATITVTNSTISGNNASGTGGGLAAFFNTVPTVTTSIIAGNTSGLVGPDVSYNITDVASGGGNLIGVSGGGSGNSGFTGAGDQTGTTAAPLNPLLAPLGSYGGATQTLLPQSGSPVINAINAGSNCPATYHDPVTNTNVSLVTDQRGIHRPQSTKCDSGAVEVATYVLTVNTVSDTAADPTGCLTGNTNTCTLRDALAVANVGLVSANPTITFAATAFPANTPRTITLNQSAGTLTLSVSQTVDGTGHQVIVDGGSSVGVFAVNSGITVKLTALTIQHGNAPLQGGGIDNRGTLTLTNSTISGNSSGVSGGGINNYGTLTLTNSTLSGNSSGVFGGGLANGDLFIAGGAVAIVNSAFIGNTTQSNGGGIDNETGNTMTVTNSTFSGNSAADGGGISNFGGALTMTNSTVSGNNAAIYPGGGIYNSSGTTTLTNTIVAANTTATSNGADLAGAIATGGHNLFGTTSGASITLGSGDLVSASPGLGALGNNGGSTQTIPLLQGSPAIDAGSDAVCAAAPVSGKDQRGVARPVGVHCDIGAFETGFLYPQPTAKPTVAGAGTPAPQPQLHPAGPAAGSTPRPQPHTANGTPSATPQSQPMRH